jgi:hypothetical protein
LAHERRVRQRLSPVKPTIRRLPPSKTAKTGMEMDRVERPPCAGPAVPLMTGCATYTVTFDVQVRFLAPARPGPIVREGCVVQLGKSIGFVEGSLRDVAGTLLAYREGFVIEYPGKPLGRTKSLKAKNRVQDSVINPM